MAKLQDKLMNRVIEGDLELDSHEDAQVASVAEAVAQSAIQADKDVLSQLVYSLDEDDNTIITFPKYVLPLRFYVEDLDLDLYFDYSRDLILNPNGEAIGEVGQADGIVTLRFDGFTVEKATDDDLTYIFSTIDTYLNTFDLYKPAGTALYQHHISIEANQGVTYDIILASNASFSVSSATLLQGLVSPSWVQTKYIVNYLGGHDNDDGFTINISYIYVDLSNNVIKIYGHHNAEAETLQYEIHITGQGGITSMTDTVTPL